ncbi:hypothetical protein E1180_21400 [Roseibium denhamense]|uniref:KDO2-lipid IV(A) lauroyltransferase n=1 Tax=Roseibium denhamense TaxID=76305 RepID=A0ABY1NR30_9HYPH|nr:lysophospholipid acyltransferase family protein [Roseibium denhamense]MTI08061.1 hypothetical protein [Roseibium denhamense]SMP15996.1 KDO2-lipid IV(A) lauroyltransferase [Roseibium denhamense]
MKRPLKLDDIPFRETLPEEPPAPPILDLWSSDAQRRQDAHLHWIRHTKDGLFNSALFSLMRLFPSRVVSNIGPLLVPLARHSYRNMVFPRRISRNFAALTPGRWQSTEARERALSNWWRNSGRTRSEFSVVNRLWDEGHICVEGRDNIERAKKLGGPLIFTSMHLATWEALFVAIHKGLDGPSIGPFQPEPNRFTNRIVYSIRKRRNQYLFPPGQLSAFRMRKLMASGCYSMTIFIDEVRNKQVHLPLFGRPVPNCGNAVVAIKIANACKGTLVPTYLIRRGPANFKQVICPPILRQPGASAYGISETIEALNQVFEPVVLKHFDEWYMLQELRLPTDFEQSEYAHQLHQTNTEQSEGPSSAQAGGSGTSA